MLLGEGSGLDSEDVVRRAQQQPVDPRARRPAGGAARAAGLWSRARCRRSTLAELSRGPSDARPSSAAPCAISASAPCSTGSPPTRPSPRPQPTDQRTVEPGEDKVTGFVFKVQANMDPKHRDRVAFVRLCSGRFQRGMKLNMVRHNKPIAIVEPDLLLRPRARDRRGGMARRHHRRAQPRPAPRRRRAHARASRSRFTGIPNFAPEILMRVRLGDPMRAKHLRAALEDLAEEGVTQVFRPELGAEWIVGVVGQLQLDVLQHPARGRVQPADRLRARPLRHRPLVRRRRRRGSSTASARPSARASPPIATATRSTSPATTGTWAGCRRISRRSASPRPASVTEPSTHSVPAGSCRPSYSPC